MTIKNRLMVLVAGGLLGLLMAVASLFWALNELRIGSQLYQEIIDDKDVIADILPPPMYVIESYLTVYQLLENLDPQAQQKLWQRMDTLKDEFKMRQQHWQANPLSDASMTALAGLVQSAEVFFAATQRLKLAEMYSIEQTKAMSDVHESYARHREQVDALVALSNEHFAHTTQLVDDKLYSNLIGVSALVFLIVLMASYVGWITMRKINQPVRQLVAFMQETTRSGDLSRRSGMTGSDEFAQIAFAFDETLNSFQHAVEEVTNVMHAIGDGQFDARVKAQYHGDLAQMKLSVNASAEQVSFMMDELSKVMSALENGNFSVKMHEAVPASFRRQVDGSMASLAQVVSDINQVMREVSQGNFDAQVQALAKGDLAELKANINASLASLSQVLLGVMQSIDQQAKGDLTYQVNVSGQGRLQNLAQGLNLSNQQLSKAISGSMRAARAVTQASNEMSAASMTLSDRTQHQAASLEETTSAMSETLSSVQATQAAAALAVQIAQQQDQARLEGQTLMNKTVVAIQNIADSSEQISSIVNVIDGIAFQTNLLALNAAVEAARAGEQGRGFAVVASEVRALAQKSAEAARDIKQLIDASVQQVREGSGLVHQVSNSLEAMGHSSIEMKQMVDKIAQATTQQTQSVNQVNVALSDIDQATQQNAALVEETAASAEGLSQQAQALLTLMQQFHVISNDAEVSNERVAPVKPTNKATNSRRVASLPAPQQTSRDEWDEF